MSRLENKKKAGYFPTPDEVTRRIARHLTPPSTGGDTGGAAAREVMGNSQVPDLGEVFVQKSRAYEGGWLGAHVDLADRPAEVARPLPPPPLEPVSGSQLSLF